MHTVEQLRFRAMGSDVHVVVVGGPLGLVRDAERRLAELDARWSRFRRTSDVTRVNDRPGQAVHVHGDTITLFRRAIDAWQRTGGRFDPTVHDSLVRCGYDRTFDDIVDACDAVDEPGRAVAVPGCASIEVDGDASTVALASGVRCDFGGIGKGLAADLVVDELVAAGAAGALVNVGGDIRASGRSPRDASWTIEVEDPFDTARALTRVALASGGDVAVATSSVLGRRWRRGTTWQHHIIDPRTGVPLRSGIVAVTVLARQAWLADVATKVLLDGGPWPSALGDAPPALVFLADGTHRRCDGIDHYLVDDPVLVPR